MKLSFRLADRAANPGNGTLEFGTVEHSFEGMRCNFGDHPHLMLSLLMTSNTDERRVAPRSSRIGFPMLKSCKAQPADFADT
jgi:hypothetical protein